LTPQRLHAELLAIETRMKIESTPYGDVGANVAGNSERQKFGCLLGYPMNPTVLS